MINGHGDDTYCYGNVRSNFSSNIYAGFSHQGLFSHLAGAMHTITGYPEPSPLSLEKQLAMSLGVEADSVMVTNGATEAIYLIAAAYRNRDAVIPQPSFAEYADACRDNHGSGRIWWICNPNNPTGRVMPKQELLGMVAEHADDIFVVDASYAGYTDMETVQAREVVGYGNMLMLGSMTKDYGIPGLRLGYVVADRGLLSSVRERRMPWSVNVLAIEAGHYLLRHHDDYRIPVAMLIAERRRMEQQLSAMGIATHPSDSHMLLCRLPHGSASQLKEWLVREQGILIRDASNFPTLTPQHFRIAVQTEAQNDELLMALRKWI